MAEEKELRRVVVQFRLKRVVAFFKDGRKVLAEGEDFEDHPLVKAAREAASE